MDLDKIFEAFVNAQTVVLCLGIYLMTYVIRKVVEGFWKGAKENRIWREVWLPLGPIVNGGALGVFAKQFVWPTAIGASMSGRIMYGAICGVFSALVYSRIRSFVQSAPAKRGGVALPAGKPVVTTTPSVPPMTSDPPAAVEEGGDPAPEETKTPPTGRG
jgi:hypothetical protein